MVPIPWSVVLPWIASVITLGWGIVQFTAQQRQANRIPFLQRQLDLCFQATETAGRLAAETDPIEWEKARVTFWRLYWGPLSIVEDSGVEAAMGALSAVVPAAPVSVPKLPMRALGGPAYDLAQASRALLLRSWNVHLPALEDQPIVGHGRRS